MQSVETVPRPITLDPATPRTAFVGASDVAAILGMSRFRSPLQVFLQKRGELPESETSPVMEWGNRLESVVRDAYADKHLPAGLRVLPSDRIGRLAHPAAPWQVCTPDAIVAEYGDEDYTGPWVYGLECKTADRAVAHLWGESGTDQVPDGYALQCHWSMWVTGLDRWDLAVLIGGNDFRAYTLRRDDELLATVLPSVESFWATVLAGGPAPEAEAADNAILSRLIRQASGELVEGDPEIDTLACELQQARVALREAEESVDAIEARIKTRIGERAGAAGPWGRIIWKANRDSETTDWKAVARDANASDDLVAAHTTTKRGARPFRATFAGGVS